MFGSKKFWIKKKLGSKIFWVIKILGQKIFWVKNFWDEINFGLKDLDLKFCRRPNQPKLTTIQQNFNPIISWEGGGVIYPPPWVNPTCFFRQKKIRIQIFLTQNFYDPKIFWHKNFFLPKIFFTQIFFYLKIILTGKIF